MTCLDHELYRHSQHHIHAPNRFAHNPTDKKTFNQLYASVEESRRCLMEDDIDDVLEESAWTVAPKRSSASRPGSLTGALLCLFSLIGMGLRAL